MEFPRRVFDGEGVRGDVDFGPTLMLNRQRCILCTRCIRFMEEVEGDAQIGVINRGYGSEIATFRDEGVQSLISGNLMDVCPVGAITTKQYRFKSRPWDNPDVADTICTFCSKGCNTNAWLKAKPEWAKGSRLVRITPRFNPDVNGYWMCDAGRFDFGWIEGDRRVHAPMLRAKGSLQPVPWNDALSTAASQLSAAARANAASVRVLVSAHAAHEEFFLIGRLIQECLGGGQSNAAVSWRVAPKQQPERTKFKIPAVDAPNVNGARIFGFAGGSIADEQGAPDISALRSAVESGAVSALYVLDGGPDGSIGDVTWILEAKRSGKLPLLIVQAVLMTELAAAADVLLPGAAAVEKDSSYTNATGTLQGTSKALNTPGEAREDWHILTSLASQMGVQFGYTSSADVRQDMSVKLAGVSALADLPALAFARPMSAQTWLEASNPSERWKWEFLYQDLPPVKGSVDQSSLPPPPGVIKLNEVK
jgi:NADH-quinone oxidoreductase subunit G